MVIVGKNLLLKSACRVPEKPCPSADSCHPKREIAFTFFSKIFWCWIEVTGLLFGTFWQAVLGWIEQAIIWVKVPNCSPMSSIQHCRVMHDRNDKVLAYKTTIQTLKKMSCKTAYGFRHRWQKRRVGNKHMDIGIYQIFWWYFFPSKIPSLEMNIIAVQGGWK